MQTLPLHFFIADHTDGTLYDTRRADWQETPLRPGYYGHKPRLETLHDIKAALRAGPYAFPGGYPLFFIMADGEPASFEGVRSEWRNVVSDCLDDAGSCWVPTALEVNYETPALFCSITGELIEAAYLDEADQREHATEASA